MEVMLENISGAGSTAALGVADACVECCALGCGGVCCTVEDIVIVEDRFTNMEGYLDCTGHIEWV